MQQRDVWVWLKAFDFNVKMELPEIWTKQELLNFKGLNVLKQQGHQSIRMDWKEICLFQQKLTGIWFFFLLF